MSNTGIVEQVRLWDGLQSYWKLDENTGTNAVDAIGGNNATLVGSATWVSGKNNYGVQCDSTTQAIQLPLSTSDFERTDKFSISMWVKRIQVSINYTYFWCHSKQTSPYSGFRLYLQTDNKIYVEIRGTTYPSHELFVSYNSASILNQTNVWYNVVFTSDGSSTAAGYKMYVNGVEMTPTVIANNLITSTKTNAIPYFGKIDGYSNNPRCSFDECCIWNRTLSATEVQMLYSAGNGKFYGTQALLQNADQIQGLTNYWRFDEVSGTTAYDSKGVNNIIKNNLTVVTGMSYNAISASGAANSYATFTTKLSTFWDNPFTVSYWFKQTAIDPVNGDLHVWAGDRNQQLYIEPSGCLAIITYDGTVGSIRTSATFSIGIWYHVVWQRISGTTGAIYVNGVNQSLSSNNMKNPAGTLTQNFRLFSREDNTAANGNLVMDELGFWNRALTPFEVKSLYNAGNGIFY